jgi:Protein of unknown function (DUF2794)
MAKVANLSDFKRLNRPVFFDRNEINRLLCVYSRRVMSGEWKDYAIGHGDGMVMFSVFRRACDRPLFTIIKCAAGSHRHGDFMLCSDRILLKRGRSLTEILSHFQRDLRLVSA